VYVAVKLAKDIDLRRYIPRKGTNKPGSDLHALHAVEENFLSRVLARGEVVPHQGR
jgi:hypothetical protein